MLASTTRTAPLTTQLDARLARRCRTRICVTRWSLARVLTACFRALEGGLACRFGSDCMRPAKCFDRVRDRLAGPLASMGPITGWHGGRRMVGRDGLADDLGPGGRMRPDGAAALRACPVRLARPPPGPLARRLADLSGLSVGGRVGVREPRLVFPSGLACITPLFPARW